MRCAQGLDDLLLNGRALCHLLVHNLPDDIVHVKRHIARVLDFRVEVEQAIVGVDAFQEELDAEGL